MRLPWPFGRSTEPPEGPAAADRPDSPPPAAHGAWASLPPIQRSIGAAPLVAPTEPFLADVPGVRPLPPIVETLGHDVTPMAPVGLVTAPVHPTPSLTSHAALIPPPVQRRAQPSTTGWASPIEPEAAAPALAPVPAPEGPSRTLAVVPPDETVQPPSRSLTHADTPVVRGPATPVLAAGEPGQRPLVSRRTQISSGTPTTVAAPTPATAPAAPATPPTASRTTESPALAHAPERSRRAGLGAPLPATPPTALRPEVVSAFPAPALAQLAAAMASGGTPGGQAAGQGPAGTPRASAAGGPPEVIPTSRIARPTAGALPLQTTRIVRRASGPAAPTGDALADQVDIGEASAPIQGMAPAGPVAAARLPVLPVVGQRRRDEGVPDGNPLSVALPVQRSVPAAKTSGLASTDGGTSERPAAARPALPMRRPLAGSRPIETSVQTLPADELYTSRPEAVDERPATLPDVTPLAAAPAVGASGEGAGATPIANQPVSLPAGYGSSMAPRRSLPASAPVQRVGAAGSGDPWAAQRTVDRAGPSAAGAQAWAAPIPAIAEGVSPPTWSLGQVSGPTVAAATPAIQRAAGRPADLRPARATDIPAGASGSGSQGWALPVPGSAAAAATPTLSLVRAPSPAAPAAASATATVQPMIARAIVAAEPAAPVVQASAQRAAPPPVLGVTATPVIQRIDGSAPPPPTAAAEHSDRELDELTRAIFGRLRTRLRSEYIHEREAKGLTFDNS